MVKLFCRLLLSRVNSPNPFSIFFSHRLFSPTLTVFGGVCLDFSDGVFFKSPHIYRCYTAVKYPKSILQLGFMTILSICKPRVQVCDFLTLGSKYETASVMLVLGAGLVLKCNHVVDGSFYVLALLGRAWLIW